MQKPPAMGRALADNLRVRYPRSHEAVAAARFADEAGGLRISYQVGIVAGYTSYLGINQANGTAVVVLPERLQLGLQRGP